MLININDILIFTEFIFMSNEKAIFQFNLVNLYSLSSNLNRFKWIINVYGNFFIYNLYFILYTFYSPLIMNYNDHIEIYFILT